MIQKIRAELLENGTISDETVALVSLLEKSHQIKKYFSKYESEQLKARLKEIKEAPSNQLVKQMVDYVDMIIAVTAVAAISTAP
ncbi:GPP34 family phosphoprotein [Pelotomaculum terephthalicicum JT]|uniref:GPP34 family phosphoprotein n=1 Tax=Pelotomaculum TaxID=191373 RepID=UPI001F049BE6|nr:MULTISPECIES: GPP34 family phosphoprotein [Pelotomaculum]MCG9969589.1 GPP34 family phosphoprotein [Pelotomaculum terephthalicicum JT]